MISTHAAVASSRQKSMADFSRSLSGVVLSVLVATTAWAQSPGSSFSAEERLEAIRQGLVQAALEGATRVESLAWIDGQGVLREGSSFRSGMEVRGVQVLGYRRDSAGQPQAQLQLPSASAPVASGLPLRKDLVSQPSTPANNCENPLALRHLMGLRMTLEGRWSVDEAPLAQALGQLTVNLLQQAGSASVGWGVLPRAAPAQSGYERVLLGTSADQWPWQARLTVKPVRPLPAPGGASYLSLRHIWADQPPVMAELSFSLLARGQSQPSLALSAQMAMPGHTLAWGRPQLDASLREKVAALVQPWLQALSEQFSCETVHPDVIAVRGLELSINAGALAGVRPGDEWLLADPQRFPQQILASGVAATAVLARVGQVYPHHAQLQVVAGPSDLVRTDWRAWRADSPVVPATVQP